jgi:hypothetical protein
MDLSTNGKSESPVSFARKATHKLRKIVSTDANDSPFLTALGWALSWVELRLEKLDSSNLDDTNRRRVIHLLAHLERLCDPLQPSSTTWLRRRWSTQYRPCDYRILQTLWRNDNGSAEEGRNLISAFQLSEAANTKSAEVRQKLLRSFINFAEVPLERIAPPLSELKKEQVTPYDHGRYQTLYVSPCSFVGRTSSCSGVFKAKLGLLHEPRQENHSVCMKMYILHRHEPRSEWKEVSVTVFAQG